MAPRKKDVNIFQQNEDKVIYRPIEDIMHDSIMPYAEYVILERALPRVEDGLKPVQRRILYTMYELSLAPDKPHRKSARIVGDALGKYHPHGDTSVYDAMVRMAQTFNMRGPLVDGHGNFGSMDGDSAAAMRYTEARLTPLAMEMLRDIDKETVPYNLNFDDTLKEPDVLPGRFPNLLVNGSTGIAVGLATNIPPHNLGEVISGVIALMENPDMTDEDIQNHIPGPDFPTGGIIIGSEEITKAYLTGKGKIIVRAKVEIEDGANGKKLLVIKELPYQVNKAVLLEKILKLSEEKKGILTGIADIRDESDRNGIRAVIEVKRDVAPEKILNYLYKYSDLQVTYGANMVAIADGKPSQMNLKTILNHYIRYQKNVVTKRTRYDLDKAKAREHILEGLMIAINNIDRMISIIRGSQNPREARKKLVAEFNLSEIQAQSILDMRLQKLTSLEIINIEKEYTLVKKTIMQLEAILGSERLLIKQIKKELEQIKKNFSDERRTIIIEDDSIADIKTEDLIYVEDTIIVLTHNMDIKRVPVKSFNRSNRDMESVDMIKGDYIEFVVDSATDHKLLFFTNAGNCYNIETREIPEKKWKDKGVKLSSILSGMDMGEKIVSLISIKDFNDETYMQFYSRNGMIKRTILSEYNSRKTRILACGLRNNDEVIGADLTDGKKDIICISEKGMSIRFHGDEVNNVGRTALGVKAMQLKKNDRLLTAYEIDDEGEIIVITDRGFGKRTLSSDYQPQGRGGIGFKTVTFNRNQSNGRQLVAAFYVKTAYELILQQKDGTLTRINTDDLDIEIRDGKGKSIVLVVMDNEIISACKNFNI